MAKNKQKNNSKTAKNNQRKKPFLTPKNIAWMVAFVILIAASVVVILKLFASPMNHSEPSSSDTDQTKSEPASKEEDPSKTAMDNSDVTDSKPDATISTESTNVENKTPAKYEGADANSFEKITGSITYNAVVDGTYRVRVSIDQLLNGNGTCTLTLKSSSQEFTRTSSTVDNPSSATCEGFDIPVAQLKSGNYSVSIEISTNTKSTTLEGVITIP